MHSLRIQWNLEILKIKRVACKISDQLYVMVQYGIQIEAAPTVQVTLDLFYFKDGYQIVCIVCAFCFVSYLET